MFASVLWLCICCIIASASKLRDPVYNEALDNGTYGDYPVRTYVTEQLLSSPRVNWLTWSPECEDGRLYFLTPRGGFLHRPGPMILDSRGDLVWSQHFDNDYGGQAYGLRVQSYRGEDFLTFWLGDDTVRGHGAGSYYMLNSSYDVVHRVVAGAGKDADLHEFSITPEGTAVMTIYEKRQIDLSFFHVDDPEDSEVDPENGWIWDCLIQEVDIESGDVLFEWRASDHVGLAEAYQFETYDGTFDTPWDCYHMNSVEKDELGNYLISARMTHSLTYIEGVTGRILWALGGKRNNFMDLDGGEALRFAWQHHARFHALDTFPAIYEAPAEQVGVERRLLSLFDNAQSEEDEDYGEVGSRGMLLEMTYPVDRAGPRQLIDMSQTIDELKKKKLDIINGTDPEFTVRLVQSYRNPRHFRTDSQGSMQVVSGDETRVLLGYGHNAVWTDFDQNGTVLCDAHFGSETSWDSGSVESYRAYKYKWTGHPRMNPKIQVSDDDLEVYMSWNGATEVAEWLLQASYYEDGDQWFDTVRVAKVGFETVVALEDTSVGSRRYLRVLALDDEGRLLEHGISELIDRSEATLLYSQGSLLDTLPFNRSFMLAVVIIAMATISCSLLKKWQGWRVGTPAVGRFRWKQGLLYRRISVEV